MKDVLIVYGTRRGATADTATIISQILQNQYSLTVDVFDVKKESQAINLDNYRNIIIGSSIAFGRWTKEAENFLKNDFSKKGVAIYVCSSDAGSAAEQDNEEAYHEVSQEYIENVIKEYNLQPIARKIFLDNFC